MLGRSHSHLILLGFGHAAGKVGSSFSFSVLASFSPQRDAFCLSLGQDEAYRVPHPRVLRVGLGFDFVRAYYTVNPNHPLFSHALMRPTAPRPILRVFHPVYESQDSRAYNLVFRSSSDSTGLEPARLVGECPGQTMPLKFLAENLSQSHEAIKTRRREAGIRFSIGIPLPTLEAMSIGPALVSVAFISDGNIPLALGRLAALRVLRSFRWEVGKLR